MNHGARRNTFEKWQELKDAAVDGVRVPDVNAGVDEGETA
jgi:hypothetical protein